VAQSFTLHKNREKKQNINQRFWKKENNKQQKKQNHRDWRTHK
jgi:hypothetical protein